MKKLLQATVDAVTPAPGAEAGAMQVDAPKPEESATARRLFLTYVLLIQHVFFGIRNDLCSFITL